MSGKRIFFILVVLGVIGGAIAQSTLAKPTDLVLTGIVTTDDVAVSALVTGQISKLLVKEGDTVQPDQLLAVLAADELNADRAFYAHAEEGAADQARETEAGLRYAQQQTQGQIQQAEAAVAEMVAQHEAASANMAQAKLTLERDETMAKTGGISGEEVERAHTDYSVSVAREMAAQKQIAAAKSSLSLARSNAEQVLAKKSALSVAERQHQAAAAQTAKADVRLRYSELHAPLGGIVDVRVASLGEVVTPGQPVLTLIDPDDLWVRADVEESYIDRVKLGDELTVRLPSGAERKGKVFYRGVDAGFATQRDVSRVKRDIKTFEIRLRLDNRDRALAVGMTAYVLLPFAGAAS